MFFYLVNSLYIIFFYQIIFGADIKAKLKNFCLYAFYADFCLVMLGLFFACLVLCVFSILFYGYFIYFLCIYKVLRKNGRGLAR